MSRSGQTLAGTAPHEVKLRHVSGSSIVTIPAAQRRYLGWRDGDTLVLLCRGRGIEITLQSPSNLGTNASSQEEAL